MYPTDPKPIPTPYRLGSYAHDEIPLYAPPSPVLPNLEPYPVAHISVPNGSPEGMETARFIERACNSHAELVAALENLLNAIRYYDIRYYDGDSRYPEEYEAGRAIVAIARGEASA